MKKITVCALFYFISLQFIYAYDPYSAADIHYRHLTNRKYEINVVFYRNCIDIPLPALNLFIHNDSFSLYTPIKRIKIEDILYNCKTKVCNPSNTTIGSYGYEAHYFRDTIDFNTGAYKNFISEKYCKLEFAVQACCRPSLIYQDDIYVEAMLDMCYAQSNPVSTSSFYNTVKTEFPFNQILNYSFRTLDYFTGDSISYDLVNGKEAYNTESNIYGGEIPITPFCIPVGINYCTPIPGALPPRGFYFNEKTGNMVLYPVGHYLSVVACRIKTFRKDSGKYKMVGYSKRDMQLNILYDTSNNIPFIDKYKETFTIKAREKFCTDIVLKDSKSKLQSTADSISIKTISQPKYGQLSLLDSFAREKTLHYCWTPSDSDYIKKKTDDIFIYAYDQGCIYGSDLSTSIYFKVIAPDSLTNISIKTYFDKNRNGKKEAGEPYRSAQVMTDNKKQQTIYQTDNNGLLSIKPFFGKYTIGIDNNQFTFPTGKDTLLISGFDSLHTVMIGFNYKQGIKGKVYEDVDKNCVFDAGTDVPLKGIKIIDQNDNAAAFSDGNGDYLFNSSVGSHTLRIDPENKFTTACSSSLSALVVKDSQFNNYNFPLKGKSAFTDIAISLNPQNHNRNNANMTQFITLENRSDLKVGKFTIKLLPSRKLFQFSNIFTNFKYKDTIYWVIDSVSAGSKKTIDFSHYMMTDSFQNGDQINYKLWADFNDSVVANNYFELTETIKDTACCKTEKVVYAQSKYYPLYKTITYRLNFMPKVSTKRAVIADTLDAAYFDLRSLRFLNNNNNLTAYLNNNVMHIDFSQSNTLNKAEFAYSIDLKVPVSDSFTIYNKARCNFYYQTLETNTVATCIVSPIVYDTLSKTVYCSNETMHLGLKVFYQPASGNHFKVYLSDSLGNFGQPSLLLDTMCAAESNVLNFKLPAVHQQNSFKLKVIGSHPAIEAFSSIKNPAIILHPLPSVKYNTNLNNGQLCLNDSLIMKAHGAHDYQFIKNGNATNSFSRDSVYSEKINANGNYRILFKSAVGCINTSPVINVNVLPLPDVKLSVTDNIICDGESLEIKFSGASTYALYRNKSMLIASNIVSSPYTFTPPVNLSYYILTGKDNNGCRDTSNQIFVLANPLPAKPIISRVNKALKSGYSFNNQWYNLSGKIDTAVNQYFYPTVDAKYFVKHIDSNGCESTSDLYDVMFTSMHPVIHQNLFIIYPNPAGEQISIENKEELKYSYSLSDAYGRIILNNISEDKINTINIEGLASGNYYLRIHTSDEVINFKVVVLNQSR